VFAEYLPVRTASSPATRGSILSAYAPVAELVDAQG
jgi:hypothetical protein